MSRISAVLSLLALLTIFLGVLACQEEAPTELPSPEARVDSVRISPSVAAVLVKRQQRFAVNVYGVGEFSREVFCRVSSGGCDVINGFSQVSFTAPDTAPALPVKLLVASAVDPTKADTAEIVVVAPVNGVAVSPNTATLVVGQKLEVVAHVLGEGNYSRKVRWQADAGSIVALNDTSAEFTAPDTVNRPPSQQVTVKATSDADSAKFGLALITVQVVVDSVKISPDNVRLQVEQSQQFTATIYCRGNCNPELRWEAKWGRVDSRGLYTAPSTVPSPPVDTVRAVSIAEPARTGLATVIVTASGTFSPAGELVMGRAYHRGTLISSDGRVLLTGGYAPCCPTGIGLAELHDPSAGTFTATGALNRPRVYHTATLLPNGKVLIAGGQTLTFVRDTTFGSAELYDNAAGTFSYTDSMRVTRAVHAAVLLLNGTVLIVGGHQIGDPAIGRPVASWATAEIYDPQTGTFAFTPGRLTVGRFSLTATRLCDGSVLIAGGDEGNGRPTRIAEVFDPVTGTFRRAGDMVVPRANHTASLLPDCKVLIVGGYTRDATGWPKLASAEIYDPLTGTFTLAASMSAARDWHVAELLPTTGKVLVAGGDTNIPGVGVLASAELYDPDSRTFGLTGSMSERRAAHASALLPDGRVLITGGFPVVLPTGRSAEIYNP